MKTRTIYPADGDNYEIIRKKNGLTLCGSKSGKPKAINSSAPVIAAKRFGMNMNVPRFIAGLIFISRTVRKTLIRRRSLIMISASRLNFSPFNSKEIVLYLKAANDS